MGYVCKCAETNTRENYLSFAMLGECWKANVLLYCAGSSFCYYDKIPDKCYLRKEELIITYALRFQSITVGKP